MKETKQAIKIYISPLAFFTQSKGTRSQFTLPPSTWKIHTQVVLPGKGRLKLLGWTCSCTQTEPVLDLALSRGQASCSPHSFLVPMFMCLK